MKLRIVLFCLLAAFLTAPSLMAAYEDIGKLEDRVREKILDNGLRVVVVERHAAPVFFSLISFRVGSCQEEPNHGGLSHFLEHMLFKGTKTLGTKDYAAEIPIMEELEETATKLRDLQVTLKPWRYEIFDEYATKVKVDLPDEVRQKVGADEAAGWRAVIEALPSDKKELPAEWHENSWTLAEEDNDYWQMYIELLESRARLVELLAEHKKYISDSEPMDAIYKRNGGERLNAFTSTDQTTYMVGLPANCLELYMFMEGDRFQNPVFREFYSERQVVQEEYRQREANPFSKMRKKMLGTAFEAHPYGKPIIGYLSDIDLSLRSDMEAHFEKYYAPNNCQLVIVGDVDTDEVFRLAEKYFASWEASEVAEEVTIVEPKQEGEKRVTVEHDSEPRVLIGYHAPAEPHPDAYALSVLRSILTGGRTSRMYKSVFQEQGLTGSAPGAWTDPGERYPSLFMITATPKHPHTTLEVEEAIYAELEKMKEEHVTQRELERLHNRLKMFELGRMASNEYLAFTLSSGFVNRGSWRSIERDLERTLAVTAEDVMRVAKKYFTEQNRTVVTLVKPDQTASADTGEMEAGQ